MFYVYILLSLKDKNFYVGFTQDLKNRIMEHESGKSISTRNRRPFRLLCYEAYLTTTEARAREKYLKSNDGRKDLRTRLAESLKEYT